MKLASTPFFTTLRLLTITVVCATSVAYADDYADVNQLLDAGKLNEAMVKADSYLAARPADPQMRFLKGVVQHSSGQQAQALATFTKLTQDYPELPEPYNNLAVLYAGQGQFDQARAALEMAIRTNPNYATAHENLGDVYARLASQAYRKALQLDGTNVAVPPKLALLADLFGPNFKGQQLAKAALASPAASDGTVQEARAVEQAVQAWAQAWSSKNVSAYLGAYGPAFDPAGTPSRSAWEEERRQQIGGTTKMDIKLEQLSVTVNGPRAIAKFRQNYHADGLAVSKRKTLELIKTGDRWLIVKETAEN